MQNIADLLAKAQKPAEEAPRLHAAYKGKVQVLPKCSLRGFEDFSIWYTPGVAAPCQAIKADPELVYEYTNKTNVIAWCPMAHGCWGWGMSVRRPAFP